MPRHVASAASPPPWQARRPPDGAELKTFMESPAPAPAEVSSVFADVDDEPVCKPADLSSVSGHTLGQRLRFANSLIGPFVSTSLMGCGKDLYVLQFGADAGVIGTILLVFSFATPVMDFLAGSLQDSGKYFADRFPMETWGRRAPWFMTHNIALVPLVYMFLMPVAFEPGMLHAWFAAVWLMWYWCYCTVINSFETSRVEIYPFKEERVELELYCKFIVVIGSAIGSVSAYLCLSFPSVFVRLVSSILCGASILSGQVAVAILREGSKAMNTLQSKENTVPWNWRQACSSGLIPRMVVIRGLQGFYEAVIPAVQVYFVTFVYSVGEKERLYWLGVSGVIVGVMEAICAPIWGKIFAKSTTLMLYLPVVLRFIDAALAPLLLLGNRDPRMLMVYLFVWRICNSGSSYWRVAAAAWICDAEDLGEGRILGLFSMVHHFGRSLASALVILGLGWAGLIAKNCLNVEAELREACEQDKIHNQPESVVQYLLYLVCWIAPALEIAICLTTLEFPVRPGSAMLDEITAKKAREVSSRASLKDAATASSMQRGVSGSPAGKSARPTMLGAPEDDEFADLVRGAEDRGPTSGNNHSTDGGEFGA